MSVVSRSSLKRLIESGDIVVRPLNESKINNCSIDVRLGQYFFRESSSQRDVYPYAGESYYDLTIWDETPHCATNSIEIGPGEIILAITEEFIGSRLECTTMAKTKSSLARYGLDLFGSSGWGDIGYINRWAFPLHNRSNKTILLRPGTWVAQIVFLTVSDVEASYTQGGNYQATDDIQTLIETWDPRSVLPKPLSVTSIEEISIDMTNALPGFTPTPVTL